MAACLETCQLSWINARRCVLRLLKRGYHSSQGSLTAYIPLRHSIHTTRPPSHILRDSQVARRCGLGLHFRQWMGGSRSGEAVPEIMHNLCLHSSNLMVDDEDGILGRRPSARDSYVAAANPWTKTSCNHNHNPFLRDNRPEGRAISLPIEPVRRALVLNTDSLPHPASVGSR